MAYGYNDTVPILDLKTNSKIGQMKLDFAVGTIYQIKNFEDSVLK